jgi:DNA-binding helix-hairpin-helix protein with protein kinase domain
MHVLLEANGRPLVLDEPPLARGGEAAVHAVAGEPGLAAKVYHRPTPEQADKLAALLAAAPPALTAPAGHVPVAWPTGRLLGTDGRGVVGCLVPRVAGARRLGELSNPRARRRLCPLFHYGYLLRGGRNLAAAVRGLHEHGFVVGDLNESNVLLTPRALVTLVDADSFQVPGPGRPYPCPVGRAEYTAPELQGADWAEAERRPEHDAFALAVLLFQMLMQGTHPFSGMFTGAGEPPPLAERIRAGHWPHAWHRDGPFQPVPQAPPWDVLPPAVAELFVRCFEDGHAAPERRPSAAAWQQALEEAEAGLTRCAANPQHRYPHGLDECPWCRLARQQDHDPFPSADELKARRLSRRMAGTAALSTPAPGEAPLALDPDDPLPPRPGSRTGAGPRTTPRRAAAGRTGWAPWIAAGAVGALLGVVTVVARYQPASQAPAAPLPAPVPAALPAPVPPPTTYRPAPRPTPQLPAPSPRESELAALTRAERAWQQARTELERALHDYQVLQVQYRTALRATGVIHPDALDVLGQKLHAQLQVVRDRERQLEDKRRRWQEAYAAVSRGGS